MGRPRKFERDELLQKALDLFWEKGYEATTVQELGTRMGLHPGSLFHTFGDKQSLFLEALGLYEERARALLLALLEAPLPKREALRQLFAAMIDNLLRARTAGRRGCFMVNTLVERCPQDPDMDRRARTNLTRLEEALERALRAAVEGGEIRPRSEEDLLALARFLMGNILAIRVLVRVGAEPSVLEDVARVALTAIDA